MPTYRRAGTYLHTTRRTPEATATRWTLSQSRLRKALSTAWSFAKTLALVWGGVGLLWAFSLLMSHIYRMGLV